METWLPVTASSENRDVYSLPRLAWELHTTCPMSHTHSTNTCTGSETSASFLLSVREPPSFKEVNVLPSQLSLQLGVTMPLNSGQRGISEVILGSTLKEKGTAFHFPFSPPTSWNAGAMAGAAAAVLRHGEAIRC